MKRRIISFLLSFAIAFVFILPTNVLAAEENIKKYCGSGYEITYDIKSRWTGNQNVEVTIKNTGTESLLNWALKYDAHGELNGLWNGTVFSSDSTKYIVKNAGYNYEILPEQSVTFGYTLSGEYMEFPETIELCSQRTEHNSEGYSVTMDITDDWDTGFIGNVTIENFGENPLEAWRLSFNTNYDITDIWNAQILSSFEDSYTVANDITTTPIGAGESKTFGFKAVKESGVTPKMTDFVMSEITVNEDFTTIDIPEIILAVSGFANYIKDKNALNIFWYTNIKNGRFELLESYNNEDFITTVILNNAYSYTYPITMDFDKRYFKVIQTTDDGQTAESPVFYVEKTEDGYSSKFIDSDEDGLPDFVEKQIGTDINNEDTDSDGLTDYQEYYILGTDPLVYDSVTEGVSDADADSDDDGLSNIKEFELGTKPFNPDTDNDGLTDGDEVNIYGTDPLKYDTDDDGISDGDEVALGTDPLSPTTDGIADTERTFVQTIDADDEILEDINTEYNPYDLSLEITAAGNAQSSLTVQESGYSDSMFNWSILGTCPELNYDDSCKVDEVVLKFKVDEEYIDNPDSEYAEENPEFAGIKRYNVFRFFEEDNILLPVKTDVDVENNTVSATVSDLGTYCLIDMECFLQDIVQGAEDFENENSEKTENEELPTLQTFSLFAARTLSAAAETAEISEAEPDKKVKPAIKYTDEFNIVFMYDSRDCTSDEDYAYFYENICDTAEFIFNQSPNANVYLLEMENASADLSYSAGSDRFSEITDGGSKYEIHDLYIFKDNFDETTSEVNLTEEEIEASLKEQSDYGKMTEEEKESYRKTQRQLDMLRNNVVVSDVFDFVLNGIDSEKVVDTDIPTLCFSFFNDKNALYNENTGRDYLSEMKNNNNIFVNLIGSYDFSTYIGGYAYDLYQQTGGKRFNLRDDTLLSERLIKYIYELSESEDIPEIENKYPMILSTGLEYVELDAPITIDYINAYRNITAANHNSSKFSGYADTDEDGLYDFEEINFSSKLIKTDGGRVVFPTFGECMDYYGDKYFYVEEGLERFYNSAPSYLHTADAHRVLYNTKVLPIKSDPTINDSDFDGANDLIDNNPLSSVRNGILKVEKSNSKEEQKYSVSYSLRFSDFFDSNNKFRPELSTTSSIFAADIYKNISFGDSNSYNNDEMVKFLEHNGFSDAEYYQLNEFSDQHITDIAVGHRYVEYHGENKEIIAVVIRGTNGTVEEWSSNFDIGCYSIFKTNYPIEKNSDWINSENHMGFDITATRVINKIDEYISSHLFKTNNISLWITGHSRGAGIANIVGAREKGKYDCFVYTFAAPRTTTIDTETAKSYDYIFNIINEDDIINQLPLKAWGFIHYGKAISVSLNNKYANKWNKLTGESYSSNSQKRLSLLSSFEKLAKNREECYEDATNMSEKQISYLLPRGQNPNPIEYGKKYVMYSCFDYGYDRRWVECQSTAYFMQYLALLAAEGQEHMTIALEEVAPIFKDVKWDFIRYSTDNDVLKGTDYISDPHLQISYYVISRG